LLREQEIDKNPMRKVKAPKTSEKLPVFVEQKNMERLFGEVDFGQGFEALRNRLILELLYATGVRVQELINIQEQHINWSNQVVKVIGKRNKERLIPLSDRLLNVLEHYLDEKQKQFSTPASELLVTDKGKKLYPKFVYRTVRYYLSLVTTVEQKSPHVLRHTFATHMVNNGADLNAVKEFLGHANLAATQVYTHNTIEKLKRIYDQAHPKA
jgi:integrase/recombinase XerC